MIEKDLLFDKRILDRNLAKGLMTRAEYDAFVAGLEDLSGAYDATKVEIGEGEFDLGARELSDEELYEQREEHNE